MAVPALRRQLPSPRYFLAAVTLSDGFEISFNKWSFHQKFLLSPRSSKRGLKLKKKVYLSGRLRQRTECELLVSLKFHNKQFVQTGVLEDLRVRLEVRSRAPGCELDLVGYFGFNTYNRSVKSRAYLAVSLALALFEFLLISHLVGSLEASDYLCSSQSVLFWTLNAALSCLFCFVNVFFCVENLANVAFFLALASLHFCNFSMLVLRLLYCIGRQRLSRLLQATPDAVG